MKCILFSFLILSAPALSAEPPLPPVSGGKEISCPNINFFNIRLQAQTELSIDDPPEGWEVIRTQNPSAKADVWFPTIPAGAMLEVRKNDLYLQCDYKPRNWIQNWVLGSATVEKKLGRFRQGMICWTFEGQNRTPVHRVVSPTEAIHLPCIGGKCELLCS